MKKVLAVLCALALAMSMSAVTFAAATPGDATPGQASTGATAATVQKLEDCMDRNDADGAAAAARELRNSVAAGMVSADVTEVMTRYIETYADSERVNDWNKEITVAATSDKAMEVRSLELVGNTLTVDMSYVNEASEFGAIVTVYVPTSSLAAGDYIWSCEGQTGSVLRIPNGETTLLSFYAPHFSQYVLSKYVAPSTQTPSTQTPSTQTPSNDAPIKDTGADMSVSLLVLAAGGIAVIGGAALTSRKLRSK